MPLHTLPREDLSVSRNSNYECDLRGRVVAAATIMNLKSGTIYIDIFHMLRLSSVSLFHDSTKKVQLNAFDKAGTSTLETI